MLPDGWRTISIQSPFRLPELRVAFEKLTETRCFPRHRFCLFVDGLDEYEGDSLEHFDLARRLKAWAASEDVNIVCSARPHTEFLDTFTNPSRIIHLHELTTKPSLKTQLVAFALKKLINTILLSLQLST